MLTEIITANKSIIKTMKLIEKQRNKKILDVKEFLLKNKLICEIKKASPLRGDININNDVIATAKNYEKFGAAAISVLTEPLFFKGKFQDLNDVSNNVSIPVLCKDFIVSEIQINNAYRTGADFILLMATVLSKKSLSALSKKARGYGLEILYEIHEYNEFEKIKDLNPSLVGVNSRNLKKMSIDKDNACEILKKLKGNFMKIAESGIETSEDIAKFKKAGADAFLIGSALMSSDNLANTFNNLKKGL